jgi:GNAT superfamily N-acetyltransferase
VDVLIREAKLADSQDAAAIVTVIDAYASDPAGGGAPLSREVRERLVPGLRRHGSAVVWLAFAAERPIGIAVCFVGYSTFRARPLLNVHDLAVLSNHRRRGVGRALLAAAERWAREHDCCKLTLEVQDANARARALYASFGFEDFVVAGSATRFLTKPLDS